MTQIEFRVIIPVIALLAAGSFGLFEKLHLQERRIRSFSDLEFGNNDGEVT